MKSALWLLIVVLAVSFLSSATAAKSFPPVSELPPRPELPDPLVMFDGTSITKKKDWFTKRKPELQNLFQHYEYGFFPPPAKIRATLVHQDKQLYGGKATLKLVTISFGPDAAPDVYLMLIVPNQRRKPAPVFMGMNFCGNHALVTNTAVPIPSGWINSKYPGVLNNRATEAGRGQLLDMWAIEQSIDRGYAVATCQYGELQPDRPDATNGVRKFFSGTSDPAHDWAMLAAWAWSLHRIVDYLVTQKDIDRKRIAVVGHSRLGKTALLAAAFDERIALAIPHQAGCGGTSPSRGKVGESVKRINDHFPHWFCAEFKKFNEQPEKIPFDQHCLIALCAPRPVLLSNAIEDTWANPEGQFEMLKAADKVYGFLGEEGVAADKMPETGRLVDSRLGYYIREGKHSMTKDDWKIFLDFADRQFGRR